MRPILKMLARLYPAAWRARYGAEYEALLEDAEPRVRDVVDVGWAAVKMWATRGSLIRVVVPFALAGAVMAIALAWLQPRKFESRTLMMMDVPYSNSLNAAIGQETEAVLTGPTLRSIIERENLYADRRALVPIDDLVHTMQKNIFVRPLQTPDGKRASGFVLGFVDADAHVAQRVDRELASAFTAANLRARIDGAGVTLPGTRLEVLYPASLPQKPVATKTGLFGAGGLIAGLLAGLIVAVVKGRRASVAAGD